MSVQYAESIAEQIVDWIRQPSSPEKDTLETFSLSLTDEGVVIRNAILGVLRPALNYQNYGAQIVIQSSLPRADLIKLARQAIERMTAP